MFGYDYLVYSYSYKMIKALRRYAKKYNTIRKRKYEYSLARCNSCIAYGVGENNKECVLDYKQSYNEIINLFSHRKDYPRMLKLMDKLAKVRNSVYFSRK